MFKAIITEDSTEIQGTTSEILTGLCCYIQALKRQEIPESLIKRTIEIGLKNEKELKDLKEEQIKREEEINKKVKELLKKIFN